MTTKTHCGVNDALMIDPVVPTVPQVSMDYSSTIQCAPEPSVERVTLNELILALALIALCLYAIREMFRSLR